MYYLDVSGHRSFSYDFQRRCFPAVVEGTFLFRRTFVPSKSLERGQRVLVSKVFDDRLRHGCRIGQKRARFSSRNATFQVRVRCFVVSFRISAIVKGTSQPRDRDSSDSKGSRTLQCIRFERSRLSKISRRNLHEGRDKIYDRRTRTGDKSFEPR